MFNPTGHTNLEYLAILFVSLQNSFSPFSCTKHRITPHIAIFLQKSSTYSEFLQERQCKQSQGHLYTIYAYIEMTRSRGHWTICDLENSAIYTSETNTEIKSYKQFQLMYIQEIIRFQSKKINILKESILLKKLQHPQDLLKMLY